jgi:hypothetical protein
MTEISVAQEIAASRQRSIPADEGKLWAHDPLEFDVIPDVICSRGKLIIESTGAVIVLMGVPIHPPPTFLFSEPDKFLDE